MPTEIGQDALVMIGPLAELPDWYWEVPYMAGRVPGGAPRQALRDGANCQLWAYGVLDHFGFAMPAFRSDALWSDGQATRRVVEPQPLDLVLYNGSSEPYGAHVGIWTGEAVAHLCLEVGRPTVWPEAEFEARPRYATRLGFKRPLLRAP
jgi:hypothetical protein